jgi:predicted RND superfamily exporter protein
MQSKLVIAAIVIAIVGVLYLSNDKVEPIASVTKESVKTEKDVKVEYEEVKETKGKTEEKTLVQAVSDEDSQYVKTQQALKEKVFNQEVTMVKKADGMPFLITSEDGKKSLTLYQNQEENQPRSEAMPPVMPTYANIPQFGGVFLPTENLTPSTIVAVTDDQGHTEYIAPTIVEAQIQVQTQEVEEEVEEATQSEEKTTKAPIVLTLPPSPGS